MTAPSVELNTPPSQPLSGVVETNAARSSDPETSQEGDLDSRSRRENQRQRLLVAYGEAGDQGLTAFEAGHLTGLASNPSCCYWKRCSELLSMGLVEESYDESGALVKRPNPQTNSGQRVLRISPFGREVLSQ